MCPEPGNHKHRGTSWRKRMKMKEAEKEDSERPEESVAARKPQGKIIPGRGNGCPMLLQGHVR